MMMGILETSTGDKYLVEGNIYTSLQQPFSFPTHIEDRPETIKITTTDLKITIDQVLSEVIGARKIDNDELLKNAFIRSGDGFEADLLADIKSTEICFQHIIEKINFRYTDVLMNDEIKEIAIHKVKDELKLNFDSSGTVIVDFD